ncbi:lysine-sensitive aspartokinase 3 [Pseudoalteromonas luteoviolacea]|uniref:lysine-sensitive aspartokinase 3 n=1 Tax=Pseudoalteromonas luteoviolacea TaxID=43657 RepID=UPI0011541AFC|nr:lysine-sensitive aspartokinase 3 [Pseudoalteromonas luteoviolacea]TQF66196.1 lysine-sensitive aspartokinase 3 [Pseudoalteromonas luteoviolacea]
MRSYVVAKFGGTSVADFDAMVRCAHIVKNNPSIRLVAVSASSGVTNHLVALTQGKLSSDEQSEHLQSILDIQGTILKKLELEDDLKEGFFSTVEKFKLTAMAPDLAINGELQDEMLSYGERLSSYLFTQVLRDLDVESIRFDVRSILRTDSHFGKAQPHLDKTRELAQEHLLPQLDDKVVVTQGFIGSDVSGRTTTLGRGGSDYSAALLAEAIDATAVHIWTDVMGVFSTDPRLCKKASPIDRLSFDEAAEMATFGAKVLHPATLLPANRSGIPVFVGSSRAPKEGGTWIEKKDEEAQMHMPGIRAVTQRKNQILLTVKSPEMLHASGFLARVFTILSKYNISVDLITTSEISVALTLDNAPNTSKPELSEACLNQLRSFCQVSVENDLSLVALIGSEIQLNTTDINLKHVLSEIGIRMICHGASRHNLCFLVKQSESDKVVQRIHAQLFE